MRRISEDNIIMKKNPFSLPRIETRKFEEDLHEFEMNLEERSIRICRRHSRRQPESRSRAGIVGSDCCYSSSPSWFSLLFFYILALACTTELVARTKLAECAKLPDIYWNSSNPIFRIDNTDHIFDVNKKQHDHDQVDLVCPQISSAQTASDSNAQTNKSSPSSNNNANANEQERYIIYSVSKEEYDTCRLSGSSARVVAVCDQSQGKSTRPPVTVTFRSFTPQPNGLEFKAGQDYYFISALIGHHQDPHKRFSPCREQNMKVIFKVCCKSAPEPIAAAVTAPSRPNSISLPPLASFRPNQPSSTRRPPLPTLRPTLAAQQKPITSGLDDYLRNLGPFGTSQQQQQQMQPITVLPIEVLSPTSNGANSDAQQTSGEPKGDSSDRNEIMQDEQQPSSTQRPALVRNNPHPPAFFPFDPTAPPDIIKNYDRWAPTPLPPDFRRPQQQLQLQPAPWQLSRNNPRLAPPPQQPRPANRLSLYPSSVWSTYDQAPPSTRDLITVPDQQLSNGANGTRNALTNWPLLSLLTLILSFLLSSMQTTSSRLRAISI